jgi:hypothetical protein
MSTGLKGSHFRGLSGIQFGQGAPGKQHTTLPPRPAQPQVAELNSHLTRSNCGQATTLRRLRRLPSTGVYAEIGAIMIVRR